MGPVELEALEALQELEALEEAVDRLARCDLAIYADSDSIERLERVRSRLGAIVAGAVAEFDASGAWAPSGARTAAAWLRRHCRLPSNEASREVRRGRQCRELPHFEAAWSAGEIGVACVDLVASVRRPATEAALARDEEMLVDYAKTLAFAEFVRVLRYWEQHADPDGAEEDAMEQHARRDVYLVPSMGGTFLGKMTLDPISGAIVSGELERLERELFEADWAKARDELGRDPRVDELGRTSAQRRADALVEMATRSATAPADGRRPAPLFSVLVDYPTLSGRICQLAQGATVISPGTLLPWLDEAYVERAVFAPGRRVEVGITSRFFTGATRRAIELRDQGCQHPYCDEPAERCQADHIVEFSKGGPTSQENGQLLCGFHNRQRNQRPPPDAGA
jgi:Domain of unknown function (DUF222)/HNH endonuclease